VRRSTTATTPATSVTSLWNRLRALLCIKLYTDNHQNLPVDRDQDCGGFTADQPPVETTAESEKATTGGGTLAAGMQGVPDSHAAISDPSTDLTLEVG
jgi:hypothetical protein